jgi:hypothetical protein
MSITIAITGGGSVGSIVLLLLLLLCLQLSTSHEHPLYSWIHLAIRPNDRFPIRQHHTVSYLRGPIHRLTLQIVRGRAGRTSLTLSLSDGDIWQTLSIWITVLRRGTLDHRRSTILLGILGWKHTLSLRIDSGRGMTIRSIEGSSLLTLLHLRRLHGVKLLLLLWMIRLILDRERVLVSLLLCELSGHGLQSLGLLSRVRLLLRQWHDHRRFRADELG